MIPKLFPGLHTIKYQKNLPQNIDWRSPSKTPASSGSSRITLRAGVYSSSTSHCWCPKPGHRPSGTLCAAFTAVPSSPRSTPRGTAGELPRRTLWSTAGERPATICLWFSKKRPNRRHPTQRGPERPQTRLARAFTRRNEAWQAGSRLGGLGLYSQ